MAAPTVAVPNLRNGDHLSRDEFERRYHAMPHVKKAELIEGRVYMPSLVRFSAHAEPHTLLTTWATLYATATPAVQTADHATVRLDMDNEVQPDVLLRIDETHGGASTISNDDYVTGAPELIVEIAHSSAAYDLHEKKMVYRRNGVREYIVWQIEENRLDWFVLDASTYRPRSPDDGRMESGVFPGLILDVAALLERDDAAVVAAVQAGVGSAAHRDFVQRLATRGE